MVFVKFDPRGDLRGNLLWLRISLPRGNFTFKNRRGGIVEIINLEGTRRSSAHLEAIYYSVDGLPSTGAAD